MTRFLSILLVAFLALQALTASAGAYCSHEQGASASHFGHHLHRHDSSGGGSGAPAQADSDCGWCAVSAAALVGSTVPVLPAQIAPAPSLRADVTAPQDFPDRPDRPKWHSERPA